MLRTQLTSEASRVLPGAQKNQKKQQETRGPEEARKRQKNQKNEPTVRPRNRTREAFQ